MLLLGFVISGIVKIDLRTLVIIIGITLMVQVIIFLIEYYYHKNYKGPGWWLLWSLSALTGYFFMLARQVKSLEHISILGQNTLLIMATTFIYIGIMRFLGKRERVGWLTAIFVLFFIPFSYFIFFDDNIHYRTIILWTAIFAVSFLSGYDLWLHKTKQVKLAANICLFVFLGHGFYAFTKVFLLLNGKVITDFYSPLFINTSSYIEALVVTIFWTYAIVVMINQQLSHEMELAKKHFEVIFSTTPDAIMITSLVEGTVNQVNDKFYELTGYTPETLLGKAMPELNLWSDPDELDHYTKCVSRYGYCFNVETSFQNRALEKFPCRISGRIIQLREEPNIISIIHDISERKQKEEKIIQQNIQLQKINSEKDKFFSIIAHDLRNPFGTFLGLTEAMADKSNNLSPDEVIKLTAVMRDSARNLYGLLENLLEWSLLEQGITKFNQTDVLLFSEIRDGILTSSDTALKKKINVVLNIPESERVFADANMLRSLIRNLVSNAIKFTHEGGTITITAQILPDKSCLISVQDTGVGMNENMRKTLFDFDAVNSRKGTNREVSSGLGLLLCKEYVSNHSGEMWVESVEGEGSTFYVRLPPVGSA